MMELLFTQIENTSATIVNITTVHLVDDILLEKLGPKQKGLAAVVTLLVIYCLIFVSGTVGNVCTCIVILRSKYMRTTTNYYLLSLAISDVSILLIGLPTEAYSIWESYPWRFGKEICIIKSLFCEMTSYASVLTITAFTIERYIAICKPLVSHKMVTDSRCVKIIISIWFVSLCCALPYPIHTELFFYAKNNNNIPILESLQCNIPAKYYTRMVHVFQLSTFVFFVFPLTVIIVLYSLIGITLRRADLRRRSSDNYRHGYSNSQTCSHTNETSPNNVPRKSVLRILVAVVVAFFVCWAPFHAQRLLTIYNTDWTPGLLFDLQSYLFYISGVLYFVGSTVNPILYNVMSRRYRMAFKETICRIYPRRSHSDNIGTHRFKQRIKTKELEEQPNASPSNTKTEMIRLTSSPPSFDRKIFKDAEKRHAIKCSYKFEPYTGSLINNENQNMHKNCTTFIRYKGQSHDNEDQLFRSDGIDNQKRKKNPFVTFIKNGSSSNGKHYLENFL